jgi:hypothetical protein
MNGRHIGITLIFTMQFPMKISPEIRCNFDYVFLKQDCMISNQKRIYDHYAGLFPTFDFFKQILDQLTTNFGTIVINNSTKKQNFTDKVQWFTVDKDIKCKIPEFIFDKQITTLKSDLISIKPDSPAKVSKKTLETLENLDYSLLEEIVQCNMKIYDLVKYSLDDKKKTTLAKLILKSNNLIINSFV